MNKTLKIIRVTEDLTQQEMADRLGITRAHYVMIENGRKKGSIDLFRRLQETFNLGDAETWQAARGGI